MNKTIFRFAVALVVALGLFAPPAAQATGGGPPFAWIGSGGGFNCALKSDNTLLCWGNYTSGQLSVPSGTYSQVSTGASTVCAVRSDSTLVCWGRNSSGEASPPGGTFTQVSARDSHSCGVRTDGTLACWGDDTHGQATPPGGTFTQVSVGSGFSCAIRSDQTLACWGWDIWEEIHPPGGTFSQVRASEGFACGLRTGGTLACWGDNSDGRATPPGGTFSQVGVGRYFGCGLKTDGTLACWGNNTYGQLSSPNGTFSQVSVGITHACAMKSDHTGTCWGQDYFGAAGSFLPTDLTATATGPSSILLSWTDNSSDATEFRVERSPNGTSGFTEIGTSLLSEYTDDLGTPDTTAYYRVRAYRSGDSRLSAYSNTAHAVSGVPMVLSIERSDADPTGALQVDFTVMFTKAVTGVDTGDFTLTTTGVSGASTESMDGSGDTYTVTVNTGVGDGTIRLDLVDDDSITDSSGNPLGGTGSGNGDFNTGEMYTVDKPLVTADFDGDGISDISYFHPATGLWSILESSEDFSYGAPSYYSWGQSGDVLAPGDYDGDGRMDPTVRRPPASGQSAAYRMLLSTTDYDFGSALTVPAGWPGLGDTPVPGDYNGDGISDPAIWRGSAGVWIIPLSPDFTTYAFYNWGQSGDKPIAVDVDGDGQTDIGYWRPSTGMWGVLISREDYSYDHAGFMNWGTSLDKPVAADYDGDGFADLAVVIPPAGGQCQAYRILLSTLAYDPAQSVTVPAGWPGLNDTPVPGDYDGDGKADAAIWRGNTGVWIIPLSSTNNTSYLFAAWGAAGDVPAR